MPNRLIASRDLATAFCAALANYRFVFIGARGVA